MRFLPVVLALVPLALQAQTSLDAQHSEIDRKATEAIPILVRALKEKAPGQILMRHTVTIEIEGEDKPALTAVWLGLMIV